MKIEVTLRVSTTVINDGAMELIRREIEQRVLHMTHDAVDAVAIRNDFRFSHDDVAVEIIK